MFKFGVFFHRCPCLKLELYRCKNCTGTKGVGYDQFVSGQHSQLFSWPSKLILVPSWKLEICNSDSVQFNSIVFSCRSMLKWHWSPPCSFLVLCRWIQTHGSPLVPSLLGVCMRWQDYGRQNNWRTYKAPVFYAENAPRKEERITRVQLSEHRIWYMTLSKYHQGVGIIPTLSHDDQHDSYSYLRR